MIDSGRGDDRLWEGCRDLMLGSPPCFVQNASVRMPRPVRVCLHCQQGENSVLSTVSKGERVCCSLSAGEKECVVHCQQGRKSVSFTEGVCQIDLRSRRRRGIRAWLSGVPRLGFMVCVPLDGIDGYGGEL